MKDTNREISWPRRYAFVLVYALLYVLAGIVLYLYDRRIPLEVGWLWLIQAVIAAVVLLWTRWWDKRPEPAKSDRGMLIFSVVYITLYIVATALFWKFFFGKSILIYQLVTLWLLLVVVPAVLLKLFKRRLPALGFRGGVWKKSLILAVVVSLVLSPLLIALSPIPKLFVAGKLPIKLILAFPIVLIFALLTAAFQEEFFFRGILQEKAQNFFHSEMNAIAFMAIFFALFHFPFTYYLEPAVQARGLLYGVVLTFFTKGAGIAVGFGLLWSRTRNMIAPTFVHAWHNALPNLTQFKF